MSSVVNRCDAAAVDAPLSHEDTSNQRKIRRACDTCHRRKVRCNGREMPGNRCSNCISAAIDCTYAAPVISKRRGSKAYIQDLETRLMNAEKLLHLVSPDISEESSSERNNENVMKPKSRKFSEPPIEFVSLFPLATLPLGSTLHRSSDCDEPCSNDDDYLTFSWAGERKCLSNRGNSKFFGKSSGLKLVQSALEYKDSCNGSWMTSRANNHSIGHDMKARRQEFWTSGAWTKPRVEPPCPCWEFPEPALLSSLVDLYFSVANNLFPLLHRSTFECSVANNLHQQDPEFGAVVLLVCAIGARFSDDPRVMHQSSEHLAGFGWFQQVQASRRPFVIMLSIYDAQVYCLSAIYLEGVSPDHLRWNIIGAGIRAIQEIGVHRRGTYSAASVESELWKRAFWTLLVLDRLTSASLGRMYALREEDFDIDLPTECDDEYWTDPDPQQTFKQPPEKPSVVSYFIQLIKLNQIHAFGLRTLYALNKSKMENAHRWERHIAAELDSALSKWETSLPAHLCWDPLRKDPLFFKQSVMLRIYYYSVQIWIHRVFLISKHSPLFRTSLTICTNAARSCCRLVDDTRPRLGVLAYKCMKPMLICATVILLDVWSCRPSGDPHHDMAQVQKCLDLFHSLETRWQLAGRIWDILHSLIHAEPVIVQSNTQGSKQYHDILPLRYVMRHKHTVICSPAKRWSPFKAPALPNPQPELPQSLGNELPRFSQQDIQSFLSDFDTQISDAALVDLLSRQIGQEDKKSFSQPPISGDILHQPFYDQELFDGLTLPPPLFFQSLNAGL